MAMTELVQARGRVDAQTVANARRTPTVPITRSSYDRRAMQEARLARGRIGAPVPAAARADVGTDRAETASAGTIVSPTDSSTAATTDAGSEEGDSQPLLVVSCIAEYPDGRGAADRVAGAAARAGAVARAAAATGDEASASEPRPRRPVDHVSARAEATAADSRLRTAALAARADQLRARLGTSAAIDLRDQAPSTASAGPASPKRRRLIRT
jgi:hypothetical protein